MLPGRATHHLTGAVGALSADALDALDLLVLGQVLALSTYEAMADADAVAELDAECLLRTVWRDGGTVVLIAHPLLAEARAQSMGPLRRRRLAGRLLDTIEPDDADPNALVLRAAWHVDAERRGGGDLLLRAASVRQLTDPTGALALIDAASAAEPGMRPCLARAATNVELGERRAAWSALDEARRWAGGDPGAAWALGLAEIDLILWADHDPARARARIEQARPHHTTPPEQAELDSLEALTWLVSAEPGRAATMADRATGVAGAAPTAPVRASLVRLVALVLAGRTGEALAIGATALRAAEAAMAEHASGAGMIRAALALARLWRGELGAVPGVHPATVRWPAPPPAGAETEATLRWPLMEGIVAHLEGDLDDATNRLEEAVVQQRGGKRLFLAETVAWLAVTLCEAGRPADAEALLDREPIGAITILPGLADWVEGTRRAACGGRDEAIDAWLAAAAQSAAAGATLLEVRYLADAVSLGAPTLAVERLRSRLDEIDAPLLEAIGRAALAVAAGDGRALLDGALEHERLGLRRRSLTLATGAVAKLDSADAASLVARLRRSLARGGPAVAPAVGLTGRELEVAQLAATGMSDREIAAKLIVSVRTVESHLASAYRKLGVTSRRNLPALVG